jgi:SOS response regulatory protein OraA/RecX
VDKNELMRQYAPLGMLAGTVRTLTELDRRLAKRGASALTADEIELARHSYYQLITAVLQREDDPEERETALRILRSTFPHIDRLMPRRTESR